MHIEIPTGQSSEARSKVQDTVVQCKQDGGDLTRNGVWLRLVIFTVLLAFAIKPIWWSGGGDSRVYLSVARSLWQDGKLLAFGQKEIFNQIGIAIYYAPAFAFGDRPFMALSIMQWLAAVGLMTACYHWLRRFMNRDDAILVTGLVIFNMCFWNYYLRFLTETWCCCLLLALALVMQQVVDTIRQDRMGRAWGYVAGSLPLLVWMVLTRHVSSMMAVGFAVVILRLAWQLRKKHIWVHCILLAVLVNAVAGGTAMGWLLYQKSTVNTDTSVMGSYVDFVAQDMAAEGYSWPKIALDNTQRRMTNVGRATVPGLFATYPETGDWLNPLSWVFAVLSIMFLIGYVKLARGSLDAYVWMAVFYFALLWVMPYEGGTRFMMPVMPVLWLSLHRFLQGRSWRKLALIILLGLHVAVTVGRVATVYPRELERHRQWPVIDQLAQRMLAIDPQIPWAAAGLDSDRSAMISFATNRPIWELDHIGDMPMPYIIVMNDTQVPEGYTLLEKVDCYHLMQHQDQ